MMRMNMFLLASLVSGAALAAAPDVSNVQVVPSDDGKSVTVSYDLGADAVVTVDFLGADGQSIGDENFRSVSGDVNRLVKGGSGRSISWAAWSDLGGLTSPPASVTAQVTAWPTDNPPPYFVADLSGVEPARFYATSNAVPGGIADSRYVIAKALLRKVPAANVTWRMGAPESQKRSVDREFDHPVRLTRNYYIGVYPVTLQQLMVVRRTWSKNSNVFNFENVAAWEGLPLEHVRHDDIRGAGRSDVWPMATVDGLMKQIREKTGIPTMDLPTEAQWEYACRAGRGTAFYNGADWPKDGSASAECKKIGWYQANWADDGELVADGNSNRTHQVGRRLPNAWGLHDMAGNSCEWVHDLCVKDLRTLTQYMDANGVFVDPLGATEAQSTVVWGGAKPTMRGGHYADAEFEMRSAYRTGEWGNNNNYICGFRLACPAAFLGSGN